MQKPLDYLIQYFGHSAFKVPQEDIIQSVLDNKDGIALLPTGGGKSVCYQIPALMVPGLCLVISPLVALMKDQVLNLQVKGIKAVALNAKLPQTDIIRIFDNCKYGDTKFLYLSPERLQSDLIIQKLKELNINLIAIDEAHCVSEWGHDFRPAYLKIAYLKELFPKVPFLALTATATPLVLKDIAQYLKINDAQVFKKSFLRKNISYQIIETEDKYSKLLGLVAKFKAPTIIYVNTRKLTKDVALFLNINNYKSTYYHGGLSPEEKELAYLDWMNENKPIIVATNAFGMGIDKSNVNTVVHYNIPNSIENYMQETGRAGRNSSAAHTFLLYNNADIDYLRKQFKNNTPTANYILDVYKKLCQYYQIAYGELNETWLDFDLAQFCKIYNLSLLTTYNTLKVLDRESILTLNNSFYKQSKIRFIASNNHVLNYSETHTSLGNLIKSILRNYGGLFEHESVINLSLIASKLNISKQSVIKQLKVLEKDGIVKFKVSDNMAQLQFLQPREDERTISNITKNIVSYFKHKEEKLEAVTHFVKNNTLCRNKQLLNYFGEKLSKNCGLCDVCKSHKKRNISVDYKAVSQAILGVLKEQPNLNSKALVSQLNFDEKHIIFTLQLLLDNNKIVVNSQHQFVLK